MCIFVPTFVYLYICVFLHTFLYRVKCFILSCSAKLGDGRQKFILKESTEGTSQCQVPRTKYSAFAYQVATQILNTTQGNIMCNNYNQCVVHIQLCVLKIFMLNEWVGASDHEEVPHSIS